MSSVNAYALALRLAGYAEKYAKYAKALRDSPCGGLERETIAHYEQVHKDLETAAKLLGPTR